MSAPALLVTAKAPVPGLAKTRLGASIGMAAAADVAAAALLDTLAAGADFERRYVAMTGDVMAAARSLELREALRGWRVFAQCEGGFDQRLAHAHAWVANDAQCPVIQIGMDTPQVDAAMLQAVSDQISEGAEVVLGPASDGGWWVLGLADGHQASALIGVPMSSSMTFEHTRQALGVERVVLTQVLRDVDTIHDAREVALAVPQSRFAQALAQSALVAGGVR